MILAIDPGTTESAYCIYDPVQHRVDMCDILANETLLRKLRAGAFEGYKPAIEMVASYGMPVGREVFETVLWIGRFVESLYPVESQLVYRLDVKTHLCKSAKAKDANIRQAILDAFPRTGGGATPQVGTKSKPGPLFGVRSHIWSALAVAMYAGREEF